MKHNTGTTTSYYHNAGTITIFYNDGSTTTVNVHVDAGFTLTSTEVWRTLVAWWNRPDSRYGDWIISDVDSMLLDRTTIRNVLLAGTETDILEIK